MNPGDHIAASRSAPDRRRSFLQLLLLAPVLASLAFTLVCLLLSAGLSNTPYETQDSAGRRIGFNDPISAEHLGILLRNVRLHTLRTPEALYLELQLVLTAFVAWRLAGTRQGNWRRMRGFLLAQIVVFPLGVIGWYSMPYFVRRLATGTLDREDFTDGFAGLLPPQSFWVAVAFTSFVVLGGLLQSSDTDPKQEGEY